MANVFADLEQALAQHDALQGFSPRLSWTHYRTLCRIQARAERLFYEIETELRAEVEREALRLNLATAEKKRDLGD